MIKIKIKNTLFRWDFEVFHLPPATITNTLCLSPDSGAVSCHLWNVETFL